MDAIGAEVAKEDNWEITTNGKGAQFAKNDKWPSSQIEARLAKAAKNPTRPRIKNRESSG